MSNIAHSSVKFLSIVKHFISIGHIHTFSHYEKIIAQGSFDRLRHGEEEAKGGVLCTISENGNSFCFIQNKLAKTFKTINIRQKDLDLALVYLEKELGKLKINSHVRIKADKDHPILRIYEDVRKKYPLFIFSKLTNETELENNQVQADQLSEFTHITMSETNIVELLIDEIQTERILNIDEKKLITECLNSIK